MALPPMQIITPQPALDPQLPLATKAEQSTIEVPEPLQVYDHESTSSTTPVVVNQTVNDGRLQQKKNNRQLDWPTLAVGFCLEAATEMAVQALKTDAVSFHLLRMLLVLAFSAIFVATNIAGKHADVARVLEHVGGFLVSTPFFFVITVAFPLCLKVISWAIYALALLVIFICNYRQLAPLSPSPTCCC